MVTDWADRIKLNITSSYCEQVIFNAIDKQIYLIGENFVWENWRNFSPTKIFPDKVSDANILRESDRSLQAILVFKKSAVMRPCIVISSNFLVTFTFYTRVTQGLKFPFVDLWWDSIDMIWAYKIKYCEAYIYKGKFWSLRKLNHCQYWVTFSRHCKVN